MTVKEFFNWLLCTANHHDWTSAALEDKKPTPEQLAGGEHGFWDYAKLYCRYCKVINPLSRRHLGH